MNQTTKKSNHILRKSKITVEAIKAMILLDELDMVMYMQVKMYRYFSKNSIFKHFNTKVLECYED